MTTLTLDELITVSHDIAADVDKTPEEMGKLVTVAARVHHETGVTSIPDLINELDKDGMDSLLAVVVAQLYSMMVGFIRSGTQ